MRLRSLVSVCLVGVIGLGVAAVPAGAHARARAADVSAGTVKLDRSGCPVYFNNGQKAPELSAPNGEHCVPLPAYLQTVRDSSSGGCIELSVVVVAVPKGTDEWAAEWPSTVGLGTQWWSGAGKPSPATTHIAYGGATFDVPKGHQAILAAEGSGGNPAGCTGPPAGTYPPQAWGVTFKRLVSGTVTIDGSGGIRAPGINMDANCAGGGTTSTDLNGNYAFLLAPGSCTIAPRLVNGELATPPRRVVTVPHHDVGHVDFQVPCDAVPVTAGTARAARARAHAAAAAANDQCKLYVKISWPDMKKPRPTGLRYQPANRSLTPDGGPLFAERVGGEQSEKLDCLSGCTLLTVTVKERNGNRLVPAKHAMLNATVGQLTPNPLLTGVLNTANEPGGYLCTTGPAVTCGADLPDLHTSPATPGVIHLVYWAPGLIDKKAPAINVKAWEPCSGKSSCPLHERQGFDREAPQLVPSKPVTAAFTLNAGEISELTHWADASTPAPVIAAYEANRAPGAASLVQSLGEHALDVSVPSGVSWGILAAQTAYDSWQAFLEVEHSAASEFMYRFGLPEVGLGVNNMNWSYQGLDPFVQGWFLDDFANWPLVSGVTSADGALFAFAKAINSDGPYAPDHTFTAAISLTDVSYCALPSSAATDGTATDFYDCGPGYFTTKVTPPACSAGATTNPTTDPSLADFMIDQNADQNIRGYIFTRFVGRLKGQAKPLVDMGFVAPYNAYAWMVALNCIQAARNHRG